MHRHLQRSFFSSLLVGFILLTACVERPTQNPCDLNTRGYELDAFCIAEVQEFGPRDVETDYLPKVVACENGAADFTALQAQAVSARSYLYYRLETGGSIAPNTSDQAYDCNREPGPEHYEAVNSTAGQVLVYNDETVAAFYVAGSIPSDRISCIAQPGDNDYSNTERYVTYNLGRSGDDLEQTNLGWVNERNYRNRGCASQNGAHCLSEAGWQYQDILRFYYGADIQIVTAEGECVDPVDTNECDIAVDDEEPTIIDEVSDCFIRSCNTGAWWWDHDAGYSGQSITTYTTDDDERDCYGRWKLDIQASGEYTVEIYAEDVFNLSNQARYVVQHGSGQDVVRIGQSGANGWMTLGTWFFAAGEAQWVELADNTGEPYTGDNSTRIVYDAIRLRPPDLIGEDTGGDGQDAGGTDTSEPDGSQTDTTHDADDSHDTSEPDAPNEDDIGAEFDTSGGSTSNGSTSTSGETTPQTQPSTSGGSTSDDGRLGLTPSVGSGDGCSTTPLSKTPPLSIWIGCLCSLIVLRRTRKSLKNHI